MRVRILEPAAEDLEAIHAYIAPDSRRKADWFIDSIKRHVNRVAATGFGAIGKPGRIRGTRELVHGRYIVVYAVDEAADELLVISIVHGARRR